MQLTIRGTLSCFLQARSPTYRLLNTNRRSTCFLHWRRANFLQRPQAMASMASKRITRSASKAAQQGATAAPDETPNIAVKSSDASAKRSDSTAATSKKRKLTEKSANAKKVSKASKKASVKGKNDADDISAAKEPNEILTSSQVSDGPAKKKSRAKKGAKKTGSTKIEERGAASADVSADNTANEIVETTCNVEWGACADEFIKIVTWNICSCRTVLKNGALLDYLKREDPDILLVQETKMTEEKVKEFPNLDSHEVYWNHSTAKKGYSGVAILCSKELLEGKGLSVVSVTPGMGNTEADSEGRVLTLLLSNDMAIVNAYVPNAGSKLARLPYRTQTFEPEMRLFLDKLRQKHRRVVYAGDLNVAHNPIDIHNSKGNQKSAGHTPQERAEFTNLLGEGWIDVFRHLYPNKRAYSYYSRRFGDRMKNENKGWRLDYHVTTKFENGEIKDCFIRYDQDGSDHLPTVILLKHEQDP